MTEMTEEEETQENFEEDFEDNANDMEEESLLIMKTMKWLLVNIRPNWKSL